MLVQSARAWVALCQHLLSHPLPEARALGALVRDELALATPRLLKHAVAKPSFEAGLRAEFEALRGPVRDSLDADFLFPDTFRFDDPATAFLEVMPSWGFTGAQAAADLAHHDNRYAYIGEGLRRTAVRFGWSAVALAEIRDLNRHRTGTKYCPLVPVGFYHAADEVPAGRDAAEYTALGEVGRAASLAAYDRLGGRKPTHLYPGEPTYLYHTLLGTQYLFEHTTTADKFLYEAELRTGTGAHFRYAKHLREVLVLWYERYPETRGLVLEGSAEPE
jgi:hypothetical protein